MYTTPSIERLATNGTLTTYTDPSIDAPTGIAAGPDGALWFVNSTSKADPNAGSIGRITTSGTVTNYTYPNSFAPYGIAAGPANTVWFTNGTVAGIPWSVEKMTTSGVVTDYANRDLGALGGAYRGGGGGIVKGPDGAMWFTDNNVPTTIIGRMTATGTRPWRKTACTTSPSSPCSTTRSSAAMRICSRWVTLEGKRDVKRQRRTACLPAAS